MNCSDHKLECEVGKYLLNRHLTMDDVHHFFGKGQKCSTSIVYISKNAPVHKTEAYVKIVDDECNYIYSEKNGWYFVYTQLFKNILLWSAHPRMFGKEGFMGNHLTIGEVDKKVTIHETIHSSRLLQIGQYNIIWDKTSRWYKTRKDGSLQPLKPSSEGAVGLWNNIAKEAAGVSTGCEVGGSGFGVTKLIKKGKRVIVRRREEESGVLRKRLQKMKEYINEPDKYMVSVRVPYNIDIADELRNVLQDNASTALWVSNVDARVSFVLFNF